MAKSFACLPRLWSWSSSTVWSAALSKNFYFNDGKMPTKWIWSGTYPIINDLLRFLFIAHVLSAHALVLTRPSDSDMGLMLAASANLITKSTPTFVMEIGQAWQWNIPRLPAYTQSVHAPVLTRPLGSNKHPHSLAVCPSLRNARYVVTGQTTIHDGSRSHPVIKYPEADMVKNSFRIL